MEFRLIYEGPLKPNGGIDHKQTLRRVFHPQLRELWKHPPLAGLARQGYSVGQFTFSSLISEYYKLVARIEILLLRPQSAGSIIVHGGDLDNRIKTLLDALRIPKGFEELPDGDSPGGDEDPFCCLLEDDALVTSLSITADTLLKPLSNSSSDVNLVIRVQTAPAPMTWKNLSI